LTQPRLSFVLVTITIVQQFKYCFIYGRL